MMIDTKSLKCCLIIEQNKIIFEDNYKQRCSMQKIDVTLGNEIWFGVDKDIIGKPIDIRMRLSQDTVKELLPYLAKFAESGEIL